jgi:hypothetical protein
MWLQRGNAETWCAGRCSGFSTARSPSAEEAEKARGRPTADGHRAEGAALGECKVGLKVAEQQRAALEVPARAQQSGGSRLQLWRCGPQRACTGLLQHRLRRVETTALYRNHTGQQSTKTVRRLAAI